MVEAAAVGAGNSNQRWSLKLPSSCGYAWLCLQVKWSNNFLSSPHKFLGKWHTHCSKFFWRVFVVNSDRQNFGCHWQLVRPRLSEPGLPHSTGERLWYWYVGNWSWPNKIVFICGSHLIFTKKSYRWAIYSTGDFDRRAPQKQLVGCGC